MHIVAEMTGRARATWITKHYQESVKSCALDYRESLLHTQKPDQEGMKKKANGTVHRIHYRCYKPPKEYTI
jgi:hypothetical protein